MRIAALAACAGALTAHAFVVPTPAVRHTLRDATTPTPALAKPPHRASSQPTMAVALPAMIAAPLAAANRGVLGAPRRRPAAPRPPRAF
jgi:hypothetical protein